MKKFIFALVLAVAVAICPFSLAVAEAAPLKIVTTIFPEYDWVREIMGEYADDAEITLLMDTKVDLHSYQPSAADLLKITQADLFIFVGGHSDEWVISALSSAGESGPKPLWLLEALGDGVKQEVHTVSEEGDDGEMHEEEHSHADEHVWLSLKNASVLVTAIENALCEMDSGHEEAYRANAEGYRQKLKALDAEYAAAVAAGSKDALLFGDRFPFRYMVDDYGLEHYAAFSGCSAESEASFETIRYLADKLDECGLNTVLTLEDSDGRIAETIIKSSKNPDAQILKMNSMQSGAGEGESYLSIMEENLKVLKEALK